MPPVAEITTKEAVIQSGMATFNSSSTTGQSQAMASNRAKFNVDDKHEINQGKILEKMLSKAMGAILHAWLDHEPKKARVASIFDGASQVEADVFVGALSELLNMLHYDQSLLLMVLCGIRRINSAERRFRVCWGNVFRVMLGGLLVNIKLHQDTCIANAEYATLVGLDRADVARLELSYMKVMQYDIEVKEDEYSSVSVDLMRHIGILVR
eukprot:TRINITY_DN13052_c0_g1_i1.p1 TRINITY_DN13052_c0_g1~~TRINITY_DN13052_c0_g1_i1.p1  ORF type:complete len:211 (+),score=23.18 TRINITY_DN13052_c0_g1_i1:45-677(+)